MATVLVAATIPCLLSCSQDRGPNEEPGVTPPTRRGQPVDVEACDLLPPAQVSEIIDRQLTVVGLRVQPPRLETVRCDLGEQFGEPVVSVELTTEPVSRLVFEEAFGEEAGGDPRSVSGVGAPSILRTEGEHQTLRSFEKGSVVAVVVPVRVARPIPLKDLIKLSRLALSQLPGNPALQQTGPIDRCAGVSDGAVESVLGRPIALREELSVGQSVECSWGGQPGAASISLTDNPSAADHFEELAVEPDYAEVTGLETSIDVLALSNTEEAGDLLVRSADWVAELHVTPSAGYSDAEIETTKAELAWAAEALAALSE